MYYYSKKSRQKIVHLGCCCYHQAMDPSTIGNFYSLAEAYNEGYRLCKHCDPLTKQYYREETALHEFCCGNGLSIHLGKRGLWVRTPRSEWRIIADENCNGTKLFHRNEIHPEARSYDRLTSYHDQKVNYPTLLEYLTYILDHDYYRMLNPVHIAPPKKEPPLKGTKRYRKALAKQRKRERNDAVRNVLTLIDSLSSPHGETVGA